MIYCLLSHFEMAHYNDLYKGAGHLKLDLNASPAEKRQRTVDALASVLPTENAREVIGEDEVTVLDRGDLTERWRRI